jgi:hypothetical protein
LRRAPLLLFAWLAACNPRTPDTPSPVPTSPSIPLSGGAVLTGEPPHRPDSVSVADLITAPMRFAGRMVRVSGRCQGWSGPAAGRPPLTRSDWQLGEKDQAVWVSGRLPAGCTGAAGGGMVTIQAQAEADTVTLGSGQPVGRAYLVIAR